MSKIAPIVLFAYDRPWHLYQTLLSLSKNNLWNESNLIIYSDGPKNVSDKQEIKRINLVREIINQFSGKDNIEVTEHDSNKGLAKSIVEGVSETLKKYNKIIVMEDDLVVHKDFLNYMNSNLDLYENDNAVMHISGFSPINLRKIVPFFLNQSHCWGWATWKRAWSQFEEDSEILLKRIIKSDRDQFDLGGGYINQLKLNCTGKLETWAVNWYASIYLANGLALHPAFNLVNNIGFDHNATHTLTSKPFKINLEHSNYSNFEKIDVSISKEGQKKLRNYYKKNLIGSNLILKLINALRTRFEDFFFNFSQDLKRVILNLNRNIHLKKGVVISKSAIINNKYGGSISIGQKTEVLDYCIISSYGGRIQIGSDCSINANAIIYGHGNVYIGNNVLIAGHTMIIPANHVFSDRNLAINKQGESKVGIIIEDDVWIGHGCTITDGIVVGKGSVLGAGIVLRESCPPYSVITHIRNGQR